MQFGVSCCCNKYSLVLMGLVGGGYVSFSPGGYRGVLDVSHKPTSDGGLIVMRMRIADLCVVVSCAVSAPGVVTEETDGWAGTV